MEPPRQVEIQLGHLCTNRCTFCVSGQRNERKTVGILETGPILDRIEEAFEAGNRKITLLGGEPTLQPGFMEVLRLCARLGYQEIVVFTNGVRTANPAFVDEVLATGGKFSWRLSVQGADSKSHENTTRRRGSFARLLKTLENLSARGQDITVNTCLVKTNYARVDLFPGLLLPFGVRQLHLDMMRPKDAGERSEAELEETIPRYSEMAPALIRMVRAFEQASPGFDVNIGNLPQCIAVEIAPWIHHDGEKTQTFAIDGDDKLSSPWNKYEVKAQDKIKVADCRGCLFDSACSGVYEAYARLHGLGELIAVDEEALGRADPKRRLLPLHLASRRAAVESIELPAPLGPAGWSVTRDDEVTIALGEGFEMVVALRPPGEIGVAATDLFSLHPRALPADRQLAMLGLEAVFSRLAEGGQILHPLGEDAILSPPGSLGARLRRLRRAAPFPHLTWTRTLISKGRVELHLTGPKGEEIVFWLEDRDGKPSGGYRLDSGEATAETIEGLRAVIAALSSRQ